MNRINAAYPDGLYYPMANESKDEIPLTLSAAAATAAFVYLHEHGHAFLANQLYVNANPKISFTDTGGMCEYTDTRLSELGAKLGPSNAKSLVASGGSVVEIIAMLAITALTRSDKRAAQIMFSKAVWISLYALSGLWPLACSPSHDFWTIRNTSGDLAYGLLTAACLATTAIVARNAWKTEEPQQVAYRRSPRFHHHRPAPIRYYPQQFRG